MESINLKHKKEEKKVPNLRFPGFEGEWEFKRLGDLSQNISYGMNSAAIKFDETNKYLRITDIDEESRRFIPKPLTSPDGKLEDKYMLRNGDIVFARTGASVGKCYLYNDSDGKLYYAGFLIKFSITGAEPYFIYLYTFSGKYRKWVQIMSMRSGQPGINSEEYKSLKFNIPSLPEQQKIASFLSAVDQKIQQLTRKKELLEQYKKGVMQKIFSQEIKFKQEDGSDFPNWEEKRLGEFASVTMGQSPDSKSYNHNANGILLIQGNADIVNRLTNPRQWTSEPTKTCEVGDLILTVRAPVGSISKSIHNACIGRGVCSIKSKNNSDIEFLYQILLDYEPNLINS